MSHESTKAAAAMHRVMRERRWTQADLVHATGLGTTTISRWVNGHQNPPDAKLATVLAALGEDPRDYGVESPRALAAVGTRSPEEQPEWAVALAQRLEAMHAEVIQRLDDLAASQEYGT